MTESSVVNNVSNSNNVHNDNMITNNADDELEHEIYEMTHGSGFIIPLIMAIIINIVFIMGFVCIIVFM